MHSNARSGSVSTEKQIWEGKCNYVAAALMWDI